MPTKNMISRAKWWFLNWFFLDRTRMSFSARFQSLRKKTERKKDLSQTGSNAREERREEQWYVCA
jgi:hypothetical protein